jgi:hypothetical protein
MRLVFLFFILLLLLDSKAQSDLSSNSNLVELDSLSQIAVDLGFLSIDEIFLQMQTDTGMEHLLNKMAVIPFNLRLELVLTNKKGQQTGFLSEELHQHFINKCRWQLVARDSTRGRVFGTEGEHLSLSAQELLRPFLLKGRDCNVDFQRAAKSSFRFGRLQQDDRHQLLLQGLFFHPASVSVREMSDGSVLQSESIWQPDTNRFFYSITADIYEDWEPVYVLEIRRKASPDLTISPIALVKISFRKHDLRVMKRAYVLDYSSKEFSIQSQFTIWMDQFSANILPLKLSYHGNVSLFGRKLDKVQLDIDYYDLEVDECVH